MADQDQVPRKLLEGLLQSILGLVIKVVGGFVHDQEVAWCQLKDRQLNLGLFTTGKQMKRLHRVGGVDPRPGQLRPDCPWLHGWKHVLNGLQRG